MTFEEILDQAAAMLQRRGRLTYSTLKRQFQLDENALNDLKDELIYGQRLAVDEDGRVLVWVGAPDITPSATSAAAGTPTRAPRAYTPAYLAEKILTSRSALEGERKQVTVLFADLKGSLELLADRDPEEARQLLDPVLERMMTAVHRYEGTVNQVMGDGIMALFGAPIAHEDHAVRACYAALAMQHAVGRYAEAVRRQQGLDVQMRVGLNSGEVVVRAIGNDLHMDYTAVGQTTHLAARMEQLARPGTTLITTDTLRLVEGLVRVTTLGPIPVKGLPEPVEVYELVGASTLRGRFQAGVMRGLTWFVGRDQELVTLQHALAQAGAGHGQVVALVGEAGVGKSRLVYEVVHAHQTQGGRVLESASASYGKATPYFPIIELLKRYSHVEDRDDVRTRRAKVTGQVLTLDDALQDTLPALFALLEALPEDSPFRTLEPPQRRQHTLQALKRVLLRESQEQPLLLVFEDLHWIDAETQALLDSLVESLPTAQLLLLVNYRPEYQHGWGSKTYYTQLRLDPLPPVSAETFLQALLGDDPSLPPLKHLLIARTEGNPFFLEETVRTLVETGVLVGTPGTYRLAKPIDSLQVPATVLAVLAARIDRRPTEEKRLLQTAAVIGTEIPLPLLQAITELPEEALHRSLTHLQAAEFLYETRLFPEHEYTFKHALTHEVAYSSLLRERRRVLHARIVATLEGLAGERLTEQVERLAHHALRGEVWDKALAYCQQAGEKALAQSAHREAVQRYEQALDALQHLPQTPAASATAIDLHLAMRTALIPLGESACIFTHMRTAEALAAEIGDRQRQGQIAAYWTRDLGLTGHNQEAVDWGQRALALLPDNITLRTTTQLYLSYAYYYWGNYHAAITTLYEALTTLPALPAGARLGAAFPAATLHHSLVQALTELGQFDEGIMHGHEAIKAAELAQHPFSLAQACRSLASLYLRQGALRPAIALFQRAQRICQEADLPYVVPYTVACLGWAYAQAGDPEEALPYLEQNRQTIASHRLESGHATMMLVLGSEGYLVVGHLATAIPLAQAALTLAQERQERGFEAYALHLLGTIAVQHTAPDVTAATRYYQQALALAQELRMRPLLAHLHYGVGTLASSLDQRVEAVTALSTAVDLYRAMAMTFWLPQAEAALAQVEGR